MIQVAALGANETKSSYSTPGSSVWISGFGGEYGYDSGLGWNVAGLKWEGPAIMTTDQSGCTNGYVGANAGDPRNLSIIILVGMQKIQIAIIPLLSMGRHRQRLQSPVW